ncbi:sensor histidine kinase [Kineococcus rubinsiae]|uniref:sensor histidine kinase n=1 Tax=Kineococcus rubinsiae TaxID=2609562 RepID=UPI0014322B7B|nr:histidine kinase [Kineococcus rubinsiae]NIZ91372.1 hypothetical protein [Kineococcus rubinsiae]
MTLHDEVAGEVRTAGTDEDTGLRRQSLLIAALCTAGDGVLFGLAISSVPGSGALSSPLTWIAAAAVLLADLALALPARTAGAVAVVHGVVRCATALLLWQASGVQDLGTGNSTGLVVAGYRAGAWVTGRASWVALAALALGMTGTQLVQGRGPGGGPVTAAVAVAVVTTVANTALPWLMGRYTTGRAGHIEEVERAAADERRRAQEDLSRALTAERGAIARDLHDTISHHVSAIGMHAAAGRLALTTPDSTGSPRRGNDLAARALDHVETSSGSAMSDLRRMLDLLAGENADGARQPGLADLDELLAGSRRAGLDVTCEVAGLDAGHLPQSVQLAAYRIVQEVLTNALRHGRGELDLTVRQESRALVVVGVNPIAAAPAGTPGGGYGLAGIRRRAEVFGGTCTSGPAADGRTWSTRATLPLEAP